MMGNYVIKSALKKGGMAEAVNRVQDVRAGETHVQKCIPLRNKRNHKRARAEINTLLKIDAHGRHLNLNAIIESEISEARGQCFVILEYCDLGNVEDEITSFRRSRQRGSESSAWNLMGGVANGLSFLHHGLKNGRRVSANWDPIFHLDPLQHFPLKQMRQAGSCRGGGLVQIPFYGPMTDSSGLYSDRLNRVVKQLCHPDARYRPIVQMWLARQQMPSS